MLFITDYLLHLLLFPSSFTCDLCVGLLNPLNALDDYIRPKTIAACIGYIKPKFLKPGSVFSIEEKICYKMVSNTLPFGC